MTLIFDIYKFNKFSLTTILSLLDDMGNRIDDLERNIAELVSQSGIEAPPKWGSHNFFSHISYFNAHFLILMLLFLI